MAFAELLQWWNLIYVLPLLLSVALIAASAVSAGEHQVDADADADGIANHDVATHAEGDADGHDSLDRALSLLGVGRAPLTIVLGTLLLSWGAFGLLMNRLIGVGPGPALVLLLPSVAATAALSVLFTRSTAGLICRIMPGTETYAVSAEQLVGRVGTAVYMVSDRAGTVQVTDQVGTVHRVAARTTPGAEPIPANRSVLLVSLDKETGFYTVEPSPL